MNEKYKVIITALLMVCFSHKNLAVASPSLFKAVDIIYKYRIILGGLYSPKYNNRKKKIELIRDIFHEPKNLYRTAVDIEKKLKEELNSNTNIHPEIEKITSMFNNNLCGKDINGIVQYSPLDKIDADALTEINEQTEGNVKLVKTTNKTLNNMTLHSDIQESCNKCTIAFYNNRTKLKKLIKNRKYFIYKIAPEHILWLNRRLNSPETNKETFDLAKFP